MMINIIYKLCGETELKITQKKLAEMAGVRESTISDIVRGSRTVINFEHLAKIASAVILPRASYVLTTSVSNAKDDESSIADIYLSKASSTGVVFKYKFRLVMVRSFFNTC